VTEAVATLDPWSPSEILRNARREVGLSQAQLAARAGIDQATLCKYETGEREPGVGVWLHLLRATTSSLKSHAIDTLSTSLEVPDIHDGELDPTVDPLRERVLAHLRRRGFTLTDDQQLRPPDTRDKHAVRTVHADAVAAQIERARGSLARYEHRFLARLSSGTDLDPTRIRPTLVPVDDRRSLDGLTWRWCSLHWSIPVSSGYGRRLRFLVLDQAHDNKVMGLIGLGDPVYALNCRDTAIGWSASQRQVRLSSVMDAFVLGAVPPYGQLCGGKLVALLATSTEVRILPRQVRTSADADSGPRS
jgi:transcriptional regulator with XRE-family HTH domain